MILRAIHELDKDYLKEVDELLKQGRLEEAKKLKITYMEKINKILNGLDYSLIQ